MKPVYTCPAFRLYFNIVIYAWVFQAPVGPLSSGFQTYKFVLVYLLEVVFLKFQVSHCALCRTKIICPGSVQNLRITVFLKKSFIYSTFVWLGRKLNTCMHKLILSFVGIIMSDAYLD
jgi:hypothetical protein